MSIPKKRSYNSTLRTERSKRTKEAILLAAKELFESKGFQEVTIEEIALKAEISAPSIYALFQSKRGLLLGLMDESLPSEQFQALVEQGKKENCPLRRLKITAKITRELYDAERNQLSFIHGTSILDPIFRELEHLREKRRYDRQKETVITMANEQVFKDVHTLTQIRDILWAFTGRDLYRMLVVERGWSSDEYEIWLAKLLIDTLLS